MAKKLKYYIPVIGPLIETIERLNKTVDNLLKDNDEKDRRILELDKRIIAHGPPDPKSDPQT